MSTYKKFDGLGKGAIYGLLLGAGLGSISDKLFLWVMGGVAVGILAGLIYDCIVLKKAKKN